MNVPLSWLKDYIDLPESIDELSDLLTFSGLEVEGIEHHGSEFDGVRVAEITAVNPHPNADKLTLCTVDIGDGEFMEVVCGAPNVAVGLKTIYAPVGSVLPNGLKLKRAKIRGVESLGMLCAEDELGLSDAHDGIMELDPTLPPGTPAVDVLGGPEVVFELEVTPNRPDCLSMIGVARELAALTGRELKRPDTPLPEPKGDRQMEVSIADSTLCPRYTARILSGVTVAPSPDWMQKRLRLCGIRPINNLVDITNYVMLETGQPLHAFDKALLEGDTIWVRPANDKEPMQTLDDAEHELKPSDLVIADASRPVALAGVMGGANSEIRNETVEVVLESAAFSSSSVRGTAKRLHAHTESSYRFARGCDITSVEWVSRRAASLMIEFAGAAPAGPVTDAYPGKQKTRTVSCEWENITRLIGVEIPVDTMKGYFARLGLNIVNESDRGCTVEIPGFRQDLTRPVDLTEEIARLNGLDSIPVRAPLARIVMGANDHETRVEMKVCRFLADRGFLEAATYSLTTPDSLSALDAANQSSQVRLPNPISQDQSVLRTSLIPQMVETLAFNKAHQNEDLALFECGKTFRSGEKAVQESMNIALGTMGSWNRPLLNRQKSPSPPEAFSDLKGEVEQLLTRLNVLGSCSYLPLQDPAFANGQAAEIHMGNAVIGRIGLLASNHLKRHKLTGPVSLAELDLGLIMPKSDHTPVMSPIPVYPSITRDVALIVDRTRTHREVEDVVDQQRPKDLEDVTVFDIFESDKLGENRKSMAYRFTYRNAKKTLTDKAVEKMHERIVDRLVSELNAEVVGR